MTAAGEFIKKHRLEYDSIVLEKEIGPYLEEMKRGLSGQPSSLLMVPTYISAGHAVTRNQKVVCVDAGGTNLRVTTAYIDSEGNFQAERIARHVMPGVDEALSGNEFFDALAEIMAPYANEVRNIVISFAFRTRTTENIDAELMALTKEVKVSGVEGKLLGAELSESLARMGIQGCKVIVINDSVGTALAGIANAEDGIYGAFTGTIIGTGSNSCYIESNSNITKLCGLDPAGVMVINTEAGSYDKLPRTDIDQAFDAATMTPGIGITEKMVSGGYLGPLCLRVLRTAAAEGVFSSRRIEEMEHLNTAGVSDFLEQRKGILANYFQVDADKENAHEILDNVVRRAARVAALQMAAMVMKAHKTNDKAYLTVEGTTYEKMHGLKEEIACVLLPYLESQGIEAEIASSIDNAVLKGCAIAGLSGNFK